MLPPKFLLVIAIVSLWLSLSNFPFEAFGDFSPTTCFNCSKCEYPCQQPSPPIPASPSFENPPPPSGYSIYQAPPPPPPQEKSHNKCPPGAAGVECCTPPAPYIYAPPNTYTYVPYGDGQGSASTLVPVLVPMMLLFPYFILLL
ncbi:hypothetical protein Lal_00021015 [Lupinus albus]|uniref:Uncharacterized protein n=1 Tax=Lupinus albus TaxID=3870 RepID=A0A6A4P1D5_LUPAL|nr:hypothetical protein Lalb_Chr15g0082131 [Lupinus albus]KAF1894723.1 hypothetical protein Lal_00021015 [Lupinus albus]